MKNNNVRNLLLGLYDHKLQRKIGLKEMDKLLYNATVKGCDSDIKAIHERQYYWATTFIKRLFINLDKGYISKKVYERLLLDVLLKGAFHIDIDKKVGKHLGNIDEYRSGYVNKLDAYKEKYGLYPPSFLVISPTQQCNLRCTNCYSSSDAKTTPHLSYEVVDKIIQEFSDEMGGRFIVISGGEPLMYKDGDKAILDLFEKYKNIFFMFYSNSTLITDEVADRLAKMGNAVPAISVEGLEAETDERRGKGIYNKILAAMEKLRKVGVPFIISVTATSKNTDILLTDEFYKTYFDKLGASFMWQFQLMPIGRGKSAFADMPNANKRIELFRKWEKLTESKKYPVADFWNSGLLTSGCIAYGRRGGYIYIDWNGNIMPCVFVPYYTDNINKLYAEGKNLSDALKSKLMANGRQWQIDHQLNDVNKKNNLLMPCSIRDHYRNFRENIITPETKGEDGPSQEVLTDKEYYETLVDYDDKLTTLSKPIWDNEYHRQ